MFSSRYAGSGTLCLALGAVCTILARRTIMPLDDASGADIRQARSRDRNELRDPAADPHRSGSQQ
jgi:hypothetical protein